MASNVTLSTLHKDRGNVKRLLTTLEKKFNAQEVSIALANAMMQEVQEIQKKFESIDQQLMELTLDDDEQALKEEKESEGIYQRCMEIKLSLGEFLFENNPQVSAQPTAQRDDANSNLDSVLSNQTNIMRQMLELQRTSMTSSSSGHGGVRTKLPQLTLPTFDGRYTEWLNFRDAFQSTIHENDDLKDNQKMQYLKRALTGEAAEEIGNVQICDRNYEPTWARLVKRYQKKTHLVNALIEEFLAQSRKKVENVLDLQAANRKYKQIFDSLNSLGEDCMTLDIWLIYLMKLNMNENFRTKWEEGRTAEKMATLEEFFDFMTQQTDVMERAAMDVSKPPSSEAKGSSKSSKTGIKTHHTEVQQCFKCRVGHPLFMCDDFKALTVDDRRNLVAKSMLCFNCLRNTHSSKKCLSKARCHKCGKRHHSLLHLPQFVGANPQTQIQGTEKSSVPALTQPVAPPISQVNATQQTPLPQPGPSGSSGVITHHSSVHHRALLPTALVNIKDVYGDYQQCRVLIDGGGECTMISEDCAQRLSLPRRHARIPVTGAAEVAIGFTRGLVQLEISSIYNPDEKIQAEAYVMQKVTSLLPPAALTEKKWPHIDSLRLADPQFKTPGKVDVILGAEYALAITLPQILKGSEGEPIAQLTIFGWIVGGKMSGEVKSFTSLHTQYDLNETLKRFWEVETIMPKQPHLTEEEQLCETHFAETHTRDKSGRYVVKLPFKPSHEDLGDSTTTAMARLQAMERRFTRKPVLQQGYKQFMDEYLALDHMELVQPDELEKPNNMKYVLPHQAVIRPTSETTKLRVVFDASAATRPNKPSLNEVLAVGPPLQDDLLVLLQRFRTHQVALSADVEKMYRQVLVSEADRDFQRVFWRQAPTEKVQTYRLKTVTYGTSCAPYLAKKVLQQIAHDYRSEFPEASQAILSSFYMDDLLCGAATVEEGKKLRREIQEVLNRGHFSLRKWSSNSEEILEEIPSDMIAITPDEIRTQSKSISALGLKWNPGNDTFSLMIDTPPLVTTKREFSSAVAKTFDPLGFVTPVTVTFKILFQLLWVPGINWESELPPDVQDHYQKVQSQFKCLQEAEIPRIIPAKEGVIELHGFSDASEKAFSAVVYAKGIDEKGQAIVNLVMAKSRVAPLSPITIPRMELNGCVLLAQIMEKLKDALSNRKIEVHAWTDSMICLQWLKDDPRKWNRYIGARTSFIMEIIPPDRWRHVSSGDNPADCASRGLLPEELMQHHLWWHGPDWLQKDETHWPATKVIKKANPDEAKPTKMQLFTSQNTEEFLFGLLENHSDYLRTVRVFALTLRFIKNTQVTEDKREKGFVTVKEQNNAADRIFAYIQQQYFPEEYKCLKSGKPLPKSSKLRHLVPYLDDSGVMRVLGRLRHAQVPERTRHPIILPSQHPLVRSLVTFTHKTHLHSGAQLTQGILRSKYWIVGMRNLVKDVIRKCVICVKVKPRTESPLMGDLPAVRVQQCRAFYNSGCDFAGPFRIRASYLRKSVVTKGYICVFVCMVTKAIHLEVVSDLSTEKFVAALRRFTARRGHCQTLYCDNATNFVGAAGATREDRLKGIRDHQNKVTKFMSSYGTQFHFIPAYSPTFGGLWERGVGNVKTHLKRVLGDSILTFEEFATVLTQIEACVNSRPLCGMSLDIEDQEPLTPAHFLVGHALTLEATEKDFTEANPNRLTRWKLLQRFVQHFWKRWNQEYITSLQQRPKWCTSTRNLEIGDLVLLRENTMKPAAWKMGRVTATHPGKDLAVRVVTIRTKDGLQKRAVNTLAKLPVE
ncbi:uncharacterized protein LOC129806693 [Phlebotomus papatasi]|uniref:uncharacterized protein LOC129806693 n=1 Tax=Phlebotomus papatasi TaxID=29031 RepID=UPI002483B082|nr:uncharacterized protein LOC129806693 [Phlebotomus papatasi]